MTNDIKTVTKTANKRGSNDPLQTGSITESVAELARRHDTWFNNEHKKSQHALYGVLADCMRVYERVKAAKKPARAYLDDYLTQQGIQVGANSSLLGKVVKAMCGAHSSKVQTYIGVLKIAANQNVLADGVKDWLIENGGISAAREKFRKQQPEGHRALLVQKGIAQLSTQTALARHTLPSDLQWDDANGTDYAIALMLKDGTKLKVMKLFTNRGIVEELLRKVGATVTVELTDLKPAKSTETREELAAKLAEQRAA